MAVWFISYCVFVSYCIVVPCIYICCKLLLDQSSIIVNRDIAHLSSYYSLFDLFVHITQIYDIPYMY